MKFYILAYDAEIIMITKDFEKIDNWVNGEVEETYPCLCAYEVDGETLKFQEIDYHSGKPVEY